MTVPTLRFPLDSHSTARSTNEKLNIFFIYLFFFMKALAVMRFDLMKRVMDWENMIYINIRKSKMAYIAMC